MRRLLLSFLPDRWGSRQLLSIVCVLVAFYLSTIFVWPRYQRPTCQCKLVPESTPSPRPKPINRCPPALNSWQEMEQSQGQIHEERQKNWNYLSQVHEKNPAIFSKWTSHLIHSMLPTYTCPVHRRYGGIPDGGKTMCDPKCTLNRTSCLVYSFGVADNCHFEHQLWKEHPNCELHLFDPTPSVSNNFNGRNICNRPAGDTRMYFHPWGLGGYEKSVVLERQRVNLSPLSDVMRRLGHEGRILDVLKVDVEGSEYDAFKYLFDKSELPAIHLLLLEGHMGKRTFEIATV